MSRFWTAKNHLWLRKFLEHNRRPVLIPSRYPLHEGWMPIFFPAELHFMSVGDTVSSVHHWRLLNFTIHPTIWRCMGILAFYKICPPFLYSMTEISPIRFFCINIFLSNFFRVLDRSYKKVPQKNRGISNSDILYIRKLVRIGSNARIPGDSHYKNKKYCSCFSKK